MRRQLGEFTVRSLWSELLDDSVRITASGQEMGDTGTAEMLENSKKVTVSPLITLLCHFLMLHSCASLPWSLTRTSTDARVFAG